MAEHNTLTGASLHEPKGVATATAGQTYIADGAGSGAWVVAEPKGIPALDHQVYHSDGTGSGSWHYIPQGWGRYSDLSGVTAFTTTPALLTIDKLGAQTTEAYLPPAIRGTGTLWNNVANTITPIAVGDTYVLRIDLPVTAKSGTPNYLKVQLDIGGAATPTIVVFEVDLAILSTPPYQLSAVIPIFCLTTFVANGGQLFLSTDTGTATITAPAIFISRETSGNI